MESVVKAIVNIVARNKAIQYIDKYINEYTIYCIQQHLKHKFYADIWHKIQRFL